MSLFNSPVFPPPQIACQFSRTAYNRLQQTTMGRVLIHLFTPLAQVLKQLVVGTPLSLRSNAGRGSEPQCPDQEPRQNLSRDSFSSTDSVSIADAIEFKLIHYQAAMKVLKAIQVQMEGPAAESLGHFADLFERSADSLRSRKLDRPSVDRTPSKQDIGGKRKNGNILDIFRRFSREQQTLIKAGLSGRGIPENTTKVHIRTALASVIHGKFRALGLQGAQYGIESIDRQIFASYVDILHEREWNTISRSHALKYRDQDGNIHALDFITTMTPAKNMDAALNSKYQESGVNGICSYAIREGRHAVNLWKTEFQPEKSDKPEIQWRFSALRHGVHDAYGIKNPADRAIANDGRVREFIHAGVLEHLSRRKISLDSINPEQELNIDLVSVNLLTPLGKEAKMIEQQQTALQRANGKRFEIQLANETGKEHTIKVVPRILMFNTPVNMLSLSMAGSLMGVWRSADSINKPALETILGPIDNSKAIGGMAGAKIKNLKTELMMLRQQGLGNSPKSEALSEKISLIHQLCTQIRDLYTKKAHHEVGNEPYKLPTRLLALANEIDATPAFNCKSGKDRTGQLNVEIRDLYAHLNAENGQLRDVNLTREGHAKENYQQLFFTGGDREIQAVNTGAPGSKSQLPYYNKLIGITPKTIDEIRGLSKWVGT